MVEKYMRNGYVNQPTPFANANENIEKARQQMNKDLGINNKNNLNEEPSLDKLVNSSPSKTDELIEKYRQEILNNKDPERWGVKPENRNKYKDVIQETMDYVLNTPDDDTIDASTDYIGKSLVEKKLLPQPEIINEINGILIDKDLSDIFDHKLIYRDRSLSKDDLMRLIHSMLGERLRLTYDEEVMLDKLVYREINNLTWMNRFKLQS